jgi:hypothetical protein
VCIYCVIYVKYNIFYLLIYFRFITGISFENGLIYSGADYSVSPNGSFSLCLFDSLRSSSRNGGVLFFRPGTVSYYYVTECTFQNQTNRNTTVNGGYIYVAKIPFVLKVFITFFFVYLFFIPHLRLTTVHFPLQIHLSVVVYTLISLEVLQIVKHLIMIFLYHY